MKIITLLPLKNDTWILRFSLKNYSLFSDEILILNDNSVDDFLSVINEFPKVKVINYDSTNERHVDMSKRRNALLQEGRKLGGTHFVWLDADEVFSENACKNIKEFVASMSQGDVAMMPWVLVHQSNQKLFVDKSKKSDLKDFIQCDDGIAQFEQKALSESRTPVPHNKAHLIEYKDGCVYHFQQLATKKNQLKQSWYRCQELIAGKRSARRINATYDFTKSIKIKNPEILNDAYVVENEHSIDRNGNTEHLNEIRNLFNKYGIEFFEPLDIWHVEELKNIFINELGRKPKEKKFPKILLKINNIVNIILNKIRSLKK